MINEEEKEAPNQEDNDAWEAVSTIRVYSITNESNKA